MTDKKTSSRWGFLRLAGTTIGAAIGGFALGAHRLEAAPQPVAPSQPTAPPQLTALPQPTVQPTATPQIEATSGLPVYNARSYGAVGDGVADDTSAINAAIAAAAAAGGGVAHLPTGTYRVTPRPHPQDGSYAPCLVMRHGVILRGAGKEATTVRLADNAALPAGSDCIYLVLNATINGALASAARDGSMVVEDLTFDGAAARQTAPTCGVFWINCRDVHHTRVRVRDVYGTGSNGGLAETFFYEFQLGAEASYSFCEAVATGDGSTASGFSADNATSVTYVGCSAYGMKVSNGFTHNTCAVLRYTDCYAHSNGMYGFNSEGAEDVRYSNCVAGARADSAGQGTFGASQPLGNTSAGFMINGSRVVDLTGCAARYNNGHGLWLAKEPDSVRVTGGEYSNNGGWGIAAMSGATNAAISHETRLAHNTAGALLAQADLNAATPFLYDSGWITATSAALAVDHALPSRPRTVTVYSSATPTPADDALVSIHGGAGAVSASSRQVVVPGLTAGMAYRVVATY